MAEAISLFLKDTLFNLTPSDVRKAIKNHDTTTTHASPIRSRGKRRPGNATQAESQAGDPVSANQAEAPSKAARKSIPVPNIPVKFKKPEEADEKQETNDTISATESTAPAKSPAVPPIPPPAPAPVAAIQAEPAGAKEETPEKTEEAIAPPPQQMAAQADQSGLPGPEDEWPQIMQMFRDLPQHANVPESDLEKWAKIQVNNGWFLGQEVPDLTAFRTEYGPEKTYAVTGEKVPTLYVYYYDGNLQQIKDQMLGSNYGGFWIYVNSLTGKESELQQKDWIEAFYSQNPVSAEEIDDLFTYIQHKKIAVKHSKSAVLAAGAKSQAFREVVEAVQLYAFKGRKVTGFGLYSLQTRTAVQRSLFAANYAGVEKYPPFIKTEEDKKFMHGQLGRDVGKNAVIAESDFKVKYVPRPRDPALGTKGYKYTLPYNTEVVVLREYGDWSYILSMTKGNPGWVENYALAYDQPEPKARLHHVQPGETLWALTKKYYGLSDENDKRLYINAVVFANFKGKRLNRFKFTKEPSWLELKDFYHYNPELKADTDIWLPSKEFIMVLKKNKQISDGSFTNLVLETAWNGATLLSDILLEGLKAVGGFIIGLIAGVFESIIDAIKAIYDFVDGAATMIMDVISGKLFSDAADLYERLKNMSVNDWVDLLSEMGAGAQKWLSDIGTKLTTGDLFDRGFYLGEIVGYIIAEIILTIITDGILAAVKWGPKVLKYLGKFGDWIIDRIKNLKGLKKPKAGNLTPDAKDLTHDAKKLDGPGHTKENNLNLEKQIDAGKSTKAKELENKVDGSKKQQLEHDAETEVDKQVSKDNPDHDSKVKALATAKVITEGADEVDLPVKVLLTELSFLKKMPGVINFISRWVSVGIYKIIMIGSELPIKLNYSVLIGWTGFSKGELEIHYKKHGHEFGEISQSEYLKKAKEFAKSEGEDLKEELIGNIVVKMNTVTKEIFIGNKKTKQIRTYYKAKGENGWEEAIELAMKKTGN